MNNFVEMDLGDSAADALLQDLVVGQTLTASRLLTALDEESEEVVLDVFEALDEKKITVVLDDIPVASTDSATAVRLRREAKLVQEDTLLIALEETDPLRLYLEELASIAVCGDLYTAAAEGGPHAGNTGCSLYQIILKLELVTGNGELQIRQLRIGQEAQGQISIVFQKHHFFEPCYLVEVAVFFHPSVPFQHIFKVQKQVGNRGAFLKAVAVVGVLGCIA